MIFRDYLMLKRKSEKNRVSLDTKRKKKDFFSGNNWDFLNAFKKSSKYFIIRKKVNPYDICRFDKWENSVSQKTVMRNDMNGTYGTVGDC